MKSDRAADLSLSRELTERQADQLTVEWLQAENLQRANFPPLVLDWGSDQPRRATPAEAAAIRGMVARG